MTEDFDKLNKIYRVSEKVEIEKYNRLGKSSKEYMAMKEMKQESDDQKDLEQVKPKMSAAEYFKQKKTNEGLQIKEVQGEGYSQLEVGYNADSPDPRVGGTKIVFDSRFDEITKQAETSKITAFMKVKAEEKQPKLTEA